MSAYITSVVKAAEESHKRAQRKAFFKQIGSWIGIAIRPIMRAVGIALGVGLLAFYLDTSPMEAMNLLIQYSK